MDLLIVFAYPFTKHKERIKKFMQTGKTDYIYKNDLDKAYFQHDMAYDKLKDLTKRTQSDKVLRDKFLKLQVIQNMTDIKRDLLQSYTSYLIKESKGSGVNFMSNQQLEKELQVNIWAVNLADMLLISKYNNGMRYLLCAIDIFSKYAWVVPLKDKKRITIVNAGQSIFDSSKWKPSKIWVDQALREKPYFPGPGIS